MVPGKVQGQRRPSVVIWGAAGHARVVADILRLQDVYDIKGFLDDVSPERRGSIFVGAPVLGGRECLPDLQKAGVEHLVVAVGHCLTRLQLAALARAEGFNLVRAIHPRAVVATDVTVGDGTVIAAGAVVNSGATISSNVIINTCASVDHDCVVAEGAHICPGARLAGSVTVGAGAWVGLGAVVIEGLRIGSNALVGAGAVVVRDVPEGVVVFGVPARLRTPQFVAEFATP